MVALDPNTFPVKVPLLSPDFSVTVPVMPRLAPA